MTFLSGFAEGYLTERKARKEREQDLDDQSFQYRMKFLTDQREKRDAKKLKETELSKQAKDLAAQFGDPESAASFYKELGNGVGYETVQKRIAEGDIQRNSLYTKPTTTVRMPTGVAVEDPLAQFPKNERVDARIDAIDPNIRTPSVDTDNEFSTLSDDPNSQFVYKPKNQDKIGSYEQATLELLKAQQNEDPAAIREAETKIKAHEITLTKQSIIKSRFEKKDGQAYVIKNKDGTMKSMFTGELGEDGTLYNTSNPKVVNGKLERRIVTAEELGQVIPITPEAIEAQERLEKDFGTRSKALIEGKSNFIGALNTSKKMIELLDRSPEVTTYAAAGLEFTKNWSIEAQTALQSVFGKKTEIEARIANNNMVGIEKDILEYEKYVQDLAERAASGSGFMGDRNNQIASDKAIYDSLKTLVAFQYAAANGVSGQNMSDKDFQKFSDISGGTKRTKEEVIAALQNAGQIVLTTLDSHSSQLNSDSGIENFEEKYGYNPGVGSKSIEQILNEQNRGDLKPMLRSVTQSVNVGKLNAAAGARPTEAVTITDKAEYDALPSGTKYIDPTGRERTKQ